MKKRLTSILIALSMMAGVMPIIGHAETEQAIDNSAMIESEIITDSDTYVDDYSYEQEIIDEEEQSSDRFIVKYKAQNQQDKKLLQTSAKTAFKELKVEKEKRIEELQANLSEDALERLHIGREKEKNKLFSLHSVSVEMLDNEPEYEIIKLEESINKQQFVSQIEAEMGDAIEYIQPDIEMEMSSMNTAEIVSAVRDKTENLSKAHNVSTGTGVTVALIDTGVDITHSALSDKVVTGWDFFNDTELTYSKEQSSAAMHGTHIAGIISQIAPEAKIMPLKVFEEGKAYTSDIIKAIKYAEENGADIVNCSWGNGAENPALKEAITESNMFFVAAAGNNRVNLDETPVYPASYALDNVINVTSVNQDGGMSYFSNYGESIDIAAWGRDVYSAMPNNEYGNMTGTSISAGYVAGAAALAAAIGTPIAELKDTLKSRANKVSTLENIVDDNNLVDFANVVYDVSPQEVTYVNAEDDFDKWKEKTPEENWELFCSSKTKKVEIGGNCNYVLKENGTVWAWGRNFAGQLGNGDYLPSATPNLVIGLDNIKEISIGDVHCLALDKNGTIWAWGNNSYSPFGDKYPSNPRIPVNLDYTDLQNVKDISAGSYYSLFLKEDGTVWGMGETTNGIFGSFTYVGKPKKIEYLSNIKSISAGNTYAMALREDGMVYSWGDNSSGQLGNGTTTKSDTPSRMQNISNVKSISAKSTHSLALKEDGTVWAWGSNIYGQLGNGTTEDKLVPVQVIGLNSTHNIKSIVQIPYGSCAIGEDGNVWYWGKNIKPLGEGTTENILTPVRSESFTDIESFFEMDEHALILKKDETILTWGYNIDGQLGDSRTICKEIPQQLPAFKNVKDILIGDLNNTTVLREDGTVWAWGYHSKKYSKTIKPTIRRIKNLTNVDSIYQYSTSYNIAIKKDGTVWMWKYMLDEDTTPVQIQNLTDVVSVYLGNSTSMALKKDGTVWYWRNNYSSPSPDISAVQIEELTDIKSICANGALKADGTVWDLSDITAPVQREELNNIVTLYNYIALKDDGTVWTWGQNTYGQLGNGTTQSNNTPTQVESLTNVKAIFGDYMRHMALKEDGTVWAWGYNHYGELGIDTQIKTCTVPTKCTTLTDVKHVEFGDSCTVALKEDGTVWTAGYNIYGNIGDGTDITRLTHVQTLNLSQIKKVSYDSSQSSIALKEDGTVWVWGANQYGQICPGGMIYSDEPYTLGSEFNSNKIVNIDILNDVNVPAETESIDTILPQQVKVTLDNGTNTDMNVKWDTADYNPNQSGEQIIYGEIQLTDGIINPDNIPAEIKVIVGEKPPEIHRIVEIEKQYITADQSVPLNTGDLEHSISEPMTVELPEKVSVHLNNGETRELNVTWRTSSYNPHLTGKQTVLGDVELAEWIENPDELLAELEITVVPTEYEVVSSNPETISIDVLAGTTKEEILEMIEPKVIDVECVNTETNEIVYIYTGFTFSEEYEENTSYDPNQLGTQPLIGRFYDNFLEVSPPYVEVEVNVVSSEIESVEEKHIDAYQCVKFEDIENIPDKVTVNLKNGMKTEVGVKWNSGNYEKDIAGDQLITGTLVNLPAGVTQPEEEKTAALIVHVKPVSYEVTAVIPDENYFDTDKDGNELSAGFELPELRKKLPVDKVKVQLTSVTEGVNISIEYELDFTLEEENNPDYISEEEYIGDLYGTLVETQNVKNPENLLYEFMVQTFAVGITEVEPASIIVDYYTEFEDINLPQTVNAKLSNGQTKEISVDWGTGEGYNPDPEGLTEDTPVTFTINGTLYDAPQYINLYPAPEVLLTITLVLPRVYTIKDISPVRIPETGTKKINLGTEISDINALIENHIATVTLENLKGVTSTQEVTFTLREEDNMHYDSMSEEEFELIAYLNLPDGILNPDNKQLVISVRPTKYIIKSVVATRVNGVLAGTAFEDIGMPDTVTVNYTDLDVKQGEVSGVIWDGSKYLPDKIGNQAVKGTFSDPLPVYVTNPNRRTPSAIVNVINPTVRMLSAKQVTETPFSSLKKSVKQAITQDEEIDGFIERKYEVELLHEDGSITTEVISIFDEIKED